LRVPLTGHEAQDPLTQKSYPPNSLVLSGRHENNNNVGTGVTTIVPRVNVGVQPTAPSVATTQPLQTAPRVLAPNRSYQPQSEAQGGQSPAGYPFLNRPAPAAPQVTAPAGNSSGFGRSYSPGVTTIAPAQGQAQYSTPSPRVGGYSQPSYAPPQPTYSAPQTHYTEAAVPSRSYSPPRQRNRIIHRRHQHRRQCQRNLLPVLPRLLDADGRVYRPMNLTRIRLMGHGTALKTAGLLLLFVMGGLKAHAGVTNTFLDGI
jgi:hypothetical protein